MNPPPPGPATNGIVTPSALAVATAASIALPPRFSTSIPAWLASASIEATAPPLPTATGVAEVLAAGWRVTAAPAQAGRPSSNVVAAATAETPSKRFIRTSPEVIRRLVISDLNPQHCTRRSLNAAREEILARHVSWPGYRAAARGR